MRVVSGCARGTGLFRPPDNRTRPTADRVKEDLFNIIAQHIAGASFLDLYAGTGQIGIEALSRGADRAVFAEADRDTVRLIERNITKCRLEGATVMCGDVPGILQNLGRAGQTFNLVYLDPPYELDELSPVLRALVDHRLLRDGAVVIAEQAAKATKIDISDMQTYKVKEYSTTKLTFMRYAEPTSREV